MLRLLVRLLGLLLLAGGFISLIVDGTASLAGGSVYVTTCGSFLQSVAPRLNEAVRQGFLARLPAAVWDGVFGVLRLTPLSLALCALGAVFVLLSHKRRATIGYVAQ
ncbi:MAG TPA: hypothetical protein VK446_11580 [Methylocystis sp.]|nr:hypothetical protein [Methylocystis sp.]